ncbi:hypothetical protein GCM10009678_25710 [Actinomadura kijaniata]|uniref:Putative membrane protein YgcG n=1 Tax=Actinomadura namibiensis TaxID=182080 RepID=A0A7W3LUJ4_ACTNM|nr:hypothetical protein [Actinomadura namibiensis]MBA8954563.1 putative membrane protein YgcG [Actinomadura namibiensis]
MTTQLRFSRTVRAAVVAVLLAVVAVLSLGLAAPAGADDNSTTIANALRQSRLYVTADVRSSVSAADQTRMRQALASARDADVRAVVINNGIGESRTRAMLADVAKRTRNADTYVAVSADGQRISAVSRTLNGSEIDRLTGQGTAGASAADQLVGFVDRAERQADDRSRGGMVGMFVTLGVLILIVAGTLGVYLVVRRRTREREAREMAELKKGVEEDVTLLGEDIARLDLNVLDKGLAPEVRDDYEKAMNSYDAAKRATDRAARPEDMRAVTEALEDGRYRMAATRARLAGEPVPERRAPCFFNPQHGPSVKDVVWAPPGGVARSVPACEADAERVMSGLSPDVRMVPYGDGRRPYWDAGPAYAPYAGGYYASYGGMDLLSGLMIGTMIGSMMTPMHYGGGFGGDYGGGGDVGGGWDFGGSDFGGGGDFGGF